MDRRPPNLPFTSRPPSQSKYATTAMHSAPSPLPPDIYRMQNPQPPSMGALEDGYIRREERNGLIQRQQYYEKHQSKNYRIAEQAERMFGQRQISQGQWHEAEITLDRIEAQERWKEEQAAKMSHIDTNGARQEWTKANPPPSSPWSSTLPPPPPPSTSFPPSLHPPTHLEDPSVPRAHRSSSPRMYAPQHHASAHHSHTSALPPPPPFPGRPIMGPASPPYSAQPPQQPRDQPLLSAIAPPTRDLPAPTSSAKPSSMSISSMLGSEPSKPREPSSYQHMNGASPIHSYPPTALQSTASSPTKPHGYAPRHQGSPEVQNHMVGATGRYRASSGGYPPSARMSVRSDSPPQNNIRPSEATHISPRSDHGGPQHWRNRPERHSDPARVLERPSSQPSGPYNSIEEINRRHADMNARPAPVNKVEPRSINSGPRPEQNHRSAYNFLNRQPQQERPESQSQSQRTNQQITQSERAQPSKYPFLSVSSGSQPPGRAPSPQNNVHKPPDQRQPSLHKGPMGPEALLRIREERLAKTQSPTQRTLSEPRPSLLDVLEDRRDEPKFHPAVLQMERSESLDKAMQHAKDGEDHHRKSLALALENHRRAGRVSPLPQPVHGAQHRTNGPSRDPSIKNEFSKMFTGVGSGAGFGGSGASTPFPPLSPKPGEEQRHPVNSRLDLEMSRSRNGSRMGKRRKGNDESKNVEGPKANGGDKAKRPRHHHHHAPHHHHHHDQAGTPIRVIGNPNATNHHHHHHRDGTIHYHPAHSKPSSTAPQSKIAAPPRLPKTTVDNTRLLSSVSHLPRRHLGSVLYSPSVENPNTSKASISASTFLPVNAKAPFSTNGFSVPSSTLNLPQRANCTLHVRIPSFYLTAHERAALCATARLWGSSVYTDDSDPLAAAIHSGLVLGAWGDDAPPSLIEPEEGEKPSETPPEKKAAMLTLLILPTLEKYAGSIRHGIKSRDWGGNHAGASFLVQEVRWVDDTKAVCEQRGLKAKRERVARGMRLSTCGVSRGVTLALGRQKIVGGEEVVAS